MKDSWHFARASKCMLHKIDARILTPQIEVGKGWILIKKIDIEYWRGGKSLLFFELL